jgi:WD40 repeat protein
VSSVSSAFSLGPRVSSLTIALSQWDWVQRDDPVFLTSGLDQLAQGSGQPYRIVRCKPSEDPATVGLAFAVAAGRAGDRDIIISGSDDGTLRVWDVATGQSVAILAGPTVARVSPRARADRVASLACQA